MKNDATHAEVLLAFEIEFERRQVHAICLDNHATSQVIVVCCRWIGMRSTQR